MDAHATPSTVLQRKYASLALKQWAQNDGNLKWIYSISSTRCAIKLFILRIDVS